MLLVKFIGKAYYATQLQNDVKSRWMSDCLDTYKKITANLSNFHLQ